MPIVYRSTLGRPLTYGEMDGNFADLAARTDTAWAMDSIEPHVRSGAGNPAELVPFMGDISAYAYAPTSMTESFADWDVPFSWAPGTDLYLAFHWSPGNSTATGNVRWGIDFTYAPVNGVFGSPTTQYVLAAATGTAYQHIQTVSSPFPGSMADPNTRFILRVFRDGANGADTFPDDAFLIGIDFYYQMSKFGVPSFLPPYP